MVDLELVNDLWTVYHQRGMHEENIKMIKKEMKKDPTEAGLSFLLIRSLESFEGDEDEVAKKRKEAIKIQEKLLSNSDDPVALQLVLTNLCSSYWKVGRKEDAMYILSALPSLSNAKENILMGLLEGKDKHQNSREAIATLSTVALAHYLVLGEFEDRTVCLKKAALIAKVISADNDDEWLEEAYSKMEDE
ncbi:MAG: hypothetical protein UH249_00440 [Acutalibacteraceae bacterium]|nr:hypothetical protein [Acutalibacteraceae bacterium]